MIGGGNHHRTTPLFPLVADRVGLSIGDRSLLDGVSFELAAGQRTIILGHNGAGKSLLLRLCHGLIVPTAGRLGWMGGAAMGAGGGPIPAHDLQARRRQAMVFQKPVLLRRTVAANLAFAAGVAGSRARRVADALAAFDLAPLARQPARVLSGGEQQRLALARAWITAPEILFLDEPTSALDPNATQAVEAAIAAFHRDGVKIVMTTHDIGQARRLADEVLFLDRGQVAEFGPAARFFAGPVSAAAQRFLAGDLNQSSHPGVGEE